MECVFCRIANGEIPSYKVHESDDFMAFMDIFPPTFGGKIRYPVVLVIPKKHLHSNVFEDLSTEEYHELLDYTRFIAHGIQEALKPLRVCLMFEGMEINHVHAKLYPVFKGSYPGYLSSEKGVNNKSTMADKKIMEEISSKIKSRLN